MSSLYQRRKSSGVVDMFMETPTFSAVMMLFVLFKQIGVSAISFPSILAV